MHISYDVVTEEGKIDILNYRQLAPMGYFDYTSVESVFEIALCGPELDKTKHGLEGRARSSQDAIE